MVGTIVTMHTYKCFSDRELLYLTAADKIAALLLESLNLNQTTSLFLSGGSTPGPVYQALSERQLSWQNVNVGLVDERWVDSENQGSNAKLIQETLLTKYAVSAKFLGMKTNHKTSRSAQANVSKLYKSISSKNAIAILGMGTDGHVCSWFPNSDGLEAALDPNNKNFVQAIRAQKSDVTGDYLERMTLTYGAIAACRSVILLITGDAKKKIIDSVLAGFDQKLPIAHLMGLKRNQLSIFYAP